MIRKTSETFKIKQLEKDLQIGFLSFLKLAIYNLEVP